MTEIKPSVPEKNPLITQTLPTIKEAPHESEPIIPPEVKEPLIIPRQIKRLSTKMKKLILKIESQFPKNAGSLYDGKNVKSKPVKNIGLMDRIREEENDKKGYNVFSNEDHMIKDLMTQFKERNAKDKIPKKIRKRMAFNRLYNISEGSIDQLKNVKKSKKKYSLAEYQENILKAVDVNSVEQGEIMRLIQNFNEIKIDSNNVKALPPINIDIIKDHVYNERKRLLLKKKKMKDLIVKKDPLDEVEKEERLIKSLKSFRSVPRKRRNKNFDILPQYIREIFDKNRF